MKKARLLTVFLVAVLMLSGCGKNSKLSASNVDANTILVKSDQKVQVATVETFDQSYYEKDELKTFITDHITEYNTSTGNEEAIKLNALDVKSKKAVMVLEYASMKDLVEFTDDKITYYDTITDEVMNQLPEEITKVKDGSSISKDELLGNSELHAVIIDAEYDILINSTIKYYSNGELDGKKIIKTGTNGPTVVIY